MIKRIRIYLTKIALVVFMCSLGTLPQGCKSTETGHKYTTVKTVRPKVRRRYYDRKKDRRKKRVKVVKMKG